MLSFVYHDNQREEIKKNEFLCKYVGEYKSYETEFLYTTLAKILSQYI